MSKRWAAWPPVIRWLAGIAAVALALALVWALFVPVAVWLAHHDVGSVKGSLYETALDNARGRLLTLGAGLFAAGALWFTARSFTLSREGQVTDRYTKAIEQLGSDKLDVRIGGIYALERVARDSAKDHPTVMEVLTAFVRENSHGRWPLPEPDVEEPERSTRPDVQAALTVVGRRDPRRDVGLIDLAGVHLTRARLDGADLTGATLTGADLTGATLVRAKLPRADLTGATLAAARLTGADLTGADLDGAHLDGADLTGAHLDGAHLDGAHLDGADLTGARLGADLTGAHLDGADLTGARLSADLTVGARLSADLTGAHLVRAKLPRADLTGVRLDRADLAAADLTGARLTLAKLPRAHLNGADLTGAHLNLADLTGADLDAATLTGADLRDADLTGVRWPGYAPVPKRWKLDTTTSGRLVSAGADSGSAE